MELITLGTARRSPEYYPWESMTFQCLQDAAAAEQSGDANSTISMVAAKGESAYDLAVAMNYGFSAGSPQALRFITEHVELIHNPPYEDWDCCESCGTTSAIDIAFRILCNPGDTVLVEKYTYPGTIASARAEGLKTLGIEMDDDGLVPEDLDQKLQNWDFAGGKKPFVLYMIPTGQIPPAQRRACNAGRPFMMLPSDMIFTYLRMIHIISCNWSTLPLDHRSNR